MNERWQHYAIWLVPERKMYEALARLIASFSQAVGAIPFAPHLTLCSGTNETAERIKALLQPALLGVTPLALPITGVNVSADFFQTLFLTFASSPELLDALVCGN